MEVEMAPLTLFGDDERGYDFVSEESLEPLRAYHAERPAVLSLYLDITPQRLASMPLRRIVEHMLEERRAVLEEREEIAAFDAAAELVKEHVIYRFRPSGRGLALFAAPEAELWRVYHLPVPVEDRLVWDHKAYLRPLLMLMDEFERYGVVLVDREKARFLLYYLGEVAEYNVAEWDATPPKTKALGWGAYTHERWLEEQYKHHFRNVAQLVQKLYERERWPHLVVGGTDQNPDSLIDELPPALQRIVAGTFNLPLTANFNEIRDEVTAIEREVERRTEAERVEAVITGAYKGQKAVLGLADTLQAVQEGRVHILVVPADFSHRGWMCDNCGGLVADLTEERPPACPYCGGPLHAERDVIDLAMQVVFDQRGQVEVVRSEEQRERLKAEGPIGAILRF